MFKGVHRARMDKAMRRGRGRLVGYVSMAALAGAFQLAAGERAASQPTAPVATAVATPAQPQPLRADQVELLMGVLGEAESHGFPANTFGQAEIQRLLASQATRQQGE